MRNEELCEVCFTTSIILVIKQEVAGGQVVIIEERKGAYRVLVWKREAKDTLVRPKCRCDNNNKKMEDAKWIYLVEESLRFL